MRWAAALLLVALSAPPAASAQEPDLSGTWKLDRRTSTIAAGAGLAGMGAGGIVDMLHVTHAANGTVTIGSQINESQARLYRPGGSSPAPGPDGTDVELKSRWESGTLVGEGPQVRETFTLSSDGATLTVTVTTNQDGGPVRSTLIYTRAASLGTCDTWPTPCRR